MNFYIDYDTYIFDCDGVLLDSNRVKDKAFFEIAREYDEEVAGEFLSYHKKNGGISRYEKFKALHTGFLPNSDLGNISKDLNKFEQYMRNLLFHCELCEGIPEVLARIGNKNMFVSSGGKQSEVQEALAAKNIGSFFLEILGSPDTKLNHLNYLKNKYKLGKVVFIGDSITDLDVSLQASLDFVFVKKYSNDPDLELPDNIVSQKVHSLKDLQ